MLALALSVVSVAGSWLLAHAIVTPAGRGSPSGPPDIAITVALAVLAVWAGVSIASLMGLDGRGWVAALNKAALASLGFTLLTAGFGIGAALTGAAIEFPVLFAAAILIGRWRGKHAEDPPLIQERKSRLPRFVYIASALTLVGFAVSSSGMASAQRDPVRGGGYRHREPVRDRAARHVQHLGHQRRHDLEQVRGARPELVHVRAQLEHLRGAGGGSVRDRCRPAWATTRSSHW